MIAWEIQTENRVGITADVLQVISSRDADIVSMEVAANRIYLKLKPLKHPEQLKELIREVPGVHRIRSVRIMPHEIREKQLDAILHTVRDGIIAVDDAQRITMVNQAASRLLGIPRDRLLNQPVGRWWPSPSSLAACLSEGRPVSWEEVKITGGKRRGKTGVYVACYPIFREGSQSGGAVVVLRDAEMVKDLLESIHLDHPVFFEDIIAVSPGMKECIRMARAVANSDATVLITGESGTGKELMARAIHQGSHRSQGPFVAINCAAIPDSLLESELFGYEEGAFTGARKGGKRGLFESADGGTLFLDEVGDMPLSLQAKLLRVLEESRFRRVGGTRSIRVDVRILSATKRNLPQLIEQRQFREDLFYRLNVIPIHLPPLRERKEEIPVLIRHFLDRWSEKETRSSWVVDPEAMTLLMEHSWPGNVRELENVMERAFHLAEGQRVKPRHLLLSPSNSPIMGTEGGPTLKERLAAVEKELLREVLSQCRSVREAARRLGLSHTALLKKIHKHGL